MGHLANGGLIIAATHVDIGLEPHRLLDFEGIGAAA
jgi:hypothetical protein